MKYPAYVSEHGIQAICPSTEQTYVLADAKVQCVGGHFFVSGKCAHCDAHMRTGADFDPLEPQVHMHEIGDPFPFGSHVRVVSRFDTYAGEWGLALGRISPGWHDVRFNDGATHPYADWELERAG